MASSNEFKITMRGKGGHAAMPHMGIDPVPVACQMVQAFQTIISRNKKPVDGRDLGHHDPRRRGHQRGARQLRAAGHGAHLHAEVLDLIERACARSPSTCGAFGAVRVRVRAQLPAHHQPPGRGRVRARVMAIVGADNVLAQEPTMGAEDFAYMLQAKPGAYFFIANGDGTHREAATAAGPARCTTPATTSTTS
jgi:hippurate hydrolase